MSNSTFALKAHRVNEPWKIHGFMSYKKVKYGFEFNKYQVNINQLLSCQRPKNTKYYSIVELFKTHNNLTKADMAELLNWDDLTRRGFYSTVFRSLTMWGILKYDRVNKWQAGPRFDEFVAFTEK